MIHLSIWITNQKTMLVYTRYVVLSMFVTALAAASLNTAQAVVGYVFV